MDTTPRVPGAGTEPIITIQPPTPGPGSEEELKFDVQVAPEALPDPIPEERRESADQDKEVKRKISESPSIKSLTPSEKPPRKISSKSLDQKLVNQHIDQQANAYKNPFDEDDDIEFGTKERKTSETDSGQQPHLTNGDDTSLSNVQLKSGNLSRRISDQSAKEESARNEKNNNKTDEPIVDQPKKLSVEQLPGEFHPVPPARRGSQPFVAQQFLDQRKSLKLPVSSLAVGMPGMEPPTPPKRRVSIASDPVTVAHCPSGPGGYDNPAFEQSLHPRRKISGVSQQSTHDDMGPVRKKSILHNAQHSGSTEHDIYHTDFRHNGGSMRSNKSSIANSVYSKHEQEALESSWIYVCCTKCRGEEMSSSWEPPHWQKLCPYPLCPSYRQFARLLSLFLLGFLIWGVVYAILGDTAAPGGQLFGLAALTVVAHFGGWLISLTTLPALIGMLIVGIIFQNTGLVDLEHEMHHLVIELRKFALVIILTRAGLEMDPGAFKKLYGVILKLGLIPWTIEAVIVAVMSHFLLDLPWMWGLLLGSIVAAVSPAVVVPCLFRLRGKGYGVAKGIPTLIIAVAGIDDAASVAIFGIISSIMFSSDSLAFQIAQGPVSVIGGIGFGVFWGWLAKYVPEKGDPFVVPLRTLMLFGGGLIAVFGSESIGFEGAGPLAVVAAAFVSCYFWSQQGWEVEDNPVSTAFEIFWMIFEPVLFGITGAGIKLNELDGSIVSLGIGCLITGILIRIICTVIVAIRCRLNLKEKFFVALSWMSKATVQAALGPVALATLQENGSEEDKRRAEIVLMVCVMSIIITAPLGAILISLSGPRLLTKTRQPQIIEGWRRSHRPSLRDISIIDEEEERDDLDDDATPSEYTEATVQNTTANAQNTFQRTGVVELGRPLPNYGS